MAFNQNQIEPTCLLCKTEEETLEHFLLNCTALHSARQPILDIIKGLYTSLHEPQLTNIPSDLLQIVLDCSALYKTVPKRNHHLLYNFIVEGLVTRYIVNATRDLPWSTRELERKRLVHKVQYTEVIQDTT